VLPPPPTAAEIARAQERQVRLGAYEINHCLVNTALKCEHVLFMSMPITLSLSPRTHRSSATRPRSPRSSGNNSKCSARRRRPLTTTTGWVRYTNPSFASTVFKTQYGRVSSTKLKSTLLNHLFCRLLLCPLWYSRS
jgi:hypothetical protein